MSPEQVSADRELDARSDVYSLACVVYEMLAGEPPHTGPTAQAVLAKVLTEEPRRLTAARTTVPEDVEYAVHKALATLPVDRFSTCSEFAKALTDPRLAPVPATRLAPRAEPAVSAAGAWQDKPSLAVLPFVNLSGDPEEDYFASGLTTDIMADLVRISGLFLVSRDSMFTYKDKSVSVRQVGRELGVHNVLEGTVRKAAKRVRITAQLVDAQSGRHIWAERYDCGLDNLFAVQDEINEEIVTALDVKLLSGEVARIFRKSLRNPRARDRYYLGLDLSYRWTKESNAEARALFSEVIQMEPECVWGYIWLAFAHYLDSAAGWSESSSASMDSAMELAHKALEVGDVTGMARLLIAQFHLFNGEHDTALMAAARALEERPSCPGAYSLHANILNYSGRPTEAMSPAKQAIRLTPRYPAWYPAVLAAAYYLAGRRDEAMDAATSAMALAPENLDVHLMLAAALAASGRTDKAKATVKEILNIDPGFTLENFSKRQPYKDPAVLESVTADLRAAGLT